MEREFGVDLKKVREFLSAREQKREQALNERFERGTREFRAIVDRIIAEIRPKRIYQWGSLLDRSVFSEISDIDIAIEGLIGPADYFRALGIAIDSATLPVDVIEIEKVPPEVATRIRSKGRLVYERKDT